MFVGFSKTLVRMGQIRIGFGARLRSKNFLAFLVVFGILYLTFYAVLWSVILAGWTLYGVFLLCFYLPYKGIKRIVNRKKIAGKG